MKNICLALLLITITKSIIAPQDFFVVSQLADKSILYVKSYKMSRTVNSNQLNIFTATKMPYSDLNELKGKQAIIINSYMHAREPYSVQLAYKLFQNIIKNKINPNLNTFLQTGIIIFYPFVNIDGYEQYIKSSSFNQIRKNMNKYNVICSSGFAGVDINRNFNSSFGSVSTSKLPCGQQYGGPSPFSQKQSQVFRQLFNLFKVILAIDIHSYGNQWIYPYASEASQQKIKKQSLYNIYTSVVNQLRSQKFTIRSCFESLNYIADGVYIDWALDQGAFSLAYQVGRTFSSDTNIQEQIQKSLQQFDILFDFLGHNIEGKKVGQQIKLKSKSLEHLQISVSFDGKIQNQTLSPGETKQFVIPQQTKKAVVSVGNRELLVFNLQVYLSASAIIIFIVLVVLTLLFILFYKMGSPQYRQKNQQAQRKQYTTSKGIIFPIQLIETQI